jgi:hypothetical protein
MLGEEVKDGCWWKRLKMDFGRKGGCLSKSWMLVEDLDVSRRGRWW